MSSVRFLLAATLALLACDGRRTVSSPNAVPPSGQGVTVEVRPSSISLLPGETADFTSVVTGTASPAVTWEVIEKGGGTVSTTGSYQAPLQPGEYTVRAASQVSPSALGTAKVKVGRVVVTVSPSAATVAAGGTIAFAADVRGTKNNSVTWSLGEPSGCGSIASSGVYTAPMAAATCHVIATSVADPSATGASTETVTAPVTQSPPPPVIVTVTPATGAVDACATLAFTATVSGTTDGRVTWSVLEGAAGGTVTTDGVYTAPAAAGTYHVIASSQATPASSTTAAVTVADRILAVAVSPATATVAPGASAQFTATVTNTCGTFTSTQTITAN